MPVVWLLYSSTDEFNAMGLDDVFNPNMGLRWDMVDGVIMKTVVVYI